MRYIDQAAQPSKESDKDSKEPRELPKPGKYDYDNLSGGKSLPLTGGNPWS